MIENLTVINLLPKTALSCSSGEVFVLKTCQRTLLVGFGQTPFYCLGDHGLGQDQITNVFAGENAYAFLLETICGLRSEVVAEYEVVAQFREAYQDYAKLAHKNNQLLGTIEKLFRDNKKIRTEHLTEIGQLSYAGIARKIIHSRVSDADVLVLGSGVLAEDLVKLLKKKHNVFISARNPKRVQELCSTYSIENVAWGKDAGHLVYAKFPFIVNTIGSSDVLFDEDFFKQFFALDNIDEQASFSQQMKLFIDLGSPSVINTSLTECDGVLRLEDIFRQSAKLNVEKLEKVKRAKEAIALIAAARTTHFPKGISFDWEEFKFAY